ncbi:MAG: nucleotide sugar dehydrogenase [Acholeplasma sp.]|nr:nucleotide sugar dehydrogenase [Acholeplasma sp.]
MINVIGLGYIGFPTSLMLASKGYKVIGTDYNEDLINRLNMGQIPFEEKGIEDLFKLSKMNKIEYSAEYQKADIYLIAVPTPYNKSTKKIDVSYILNSICSILKVCNPNAIIIIESTISPGTIDIVLKPYIESFGYTIGKDIHLVHAPERIIPGNMIYELTHNSRTIGADNPIIGDKIADIYRKITSGDVIVTNIKTAEMTKVVENTYRAINIAFANELAKIARFDNMDVYEIIRICNMHPRVNILSPGPGVGGHCIPVDPWFLVGDYPNLTPLIKNALEINESMPDYVLARALEISHENGIQDISRIGIYGLTYKENVDDYRESPSIQLLNSQIRHLAEPLKIYDPNISRKISKNQYFDLITFLDDVDMVIIMVKHDEILRKLELFKNKIIFDTQNIINSGNVYHL